MKAGLAVALMPVLVAASPVEMRAQPERDVIAVVAGDLQATAIPRQVSDSAGYVFAPELWLMESRLCYPRETACAESEGFEDRQRMVAQLLQARRVGVDSSATPEGRRLQIGVTVFPLLEREALVRVQQKWTVFELGRTKRVTVTMEYELERPANDWRIRSKKYVGGS